MEDPGFGTDSQVREFTSQSAIEEDGSISTQRELSWISLDLFPLQEREQHGVLPTSYVPLGLRINEIPQTGQILLSICNGFLCRCPWSFQVIKRRLVIWLLWVSSSVWWTTSDGSRYRPRNISISSLCSRTYPFAVALGWSGTRP